MLKDNCIVSIVVRAILDGELGPRECKVIENNARYSSKVNQMLMKVPA